MATTAPLERRRDGPRSSQRLSRLRVYPVSRGRLLYWRPDSQAWVIARPILIDGAELSDDELAGILPLMFTDDSPCRDTPSLDLLERLTGERSVAHKTGSGDTEQAAPRGEIPAAAPHRKVRL